MNHIVEPKGVTLRAAMQLEAASKIQGLIRKVRSTRLFVNILKFKRRDDVSFLVDLLKRGIQVVKIRSDGGAAKKRFLALKVGTSLADSRIYTYANGMIKDTSKGAYLVDIADIRLGAHSYLFSHIRDHLDHEKCLSIVCGERTFDLQILHGTESRNWLAGILLLLVDQILPDKDVHKRGRTEGSRLLNRMKRGWPTGLYKDATRIKNVLDADGINIKEYCADGVIKEKKLWISSARRRMYLGDIPDVDSNANSSSSSSSGNGNGNDKSVATNGVEYGVKDKENAGDLPKGIDFDDISEVRSGLITAALDKKIADSDLMITVVGSETVFTLLVLRENRQEAKTIHAKILSDLQAFNKVNTSPPVERLSLPPIGSDSGFTLPSDAQFANQQRGGVDDWDDSASSVTMWSQAESYEGNGDEVKLDL